MLWEKEEEREEKEEKNPKKESPCTKMPSKS